MLRTSTVTCLIYSPVSIKPSASCTILVWNPFPIHLCVCEFVFIVYRCSENFLWMYRTGNLHPTLWTSLTICCILIVYSGGYLRQFLVDDKGCVLIACWGMPHMSYVDNVHRALSACAQIQQELHKLGMFFMFFRAWLCLMLNGCWLCLGFACKYCNFVLGATCGRCKADMNSQVIHILPSLNNSIFFLFFLLRHANFCGHHHRRRVLRHGRQLQTDGVRRDCLLCEHVCSIDGQSQRKTAHWWVCKTSFF